MGGSVLSLSDFYGSGGPAGSASQEPAVETASGPLGAETTSAGAAFSWLGFVILLVALRVIYEVSD